MHKNFHIEEGTKVSASTSLPGSVSRVSGMMFAIACRKVPEFIDYGSLEVSRFSRLQSVVKGCGFFENISCKCV